MYCEMHYKTLGIDLAGVLEDNC